MMNFDSGTAYAESDADDEYERSVHDSSPVLVTDSEASPTESERTSNEHTPTTYGHERAADQLPESIISEWTEGECADFIATIGLQQYSHKFLENGIVGEALIALQHEDLKSVGITSVGHRLTILKSVYDLKITQDIPIESDHYIPLTADAEAQYATATLRDIKLLADQLRLRDERMSYMEQDLRRVTDEFRRLREDVLPVIRMAKEQQPLPNVNNNNQPIYGYETIVSPPAPTPPPSQPNTGIMRTLSTKKIAPPPQPPKSTSPTHMQTTYDRSMEQTLDPSSAAERAVMSSTHLAAMNGSGHTAQSPGYSPNIPSPTSPPTTLGGTTLQSRSYRSDQQPPSSTRSAFPENDHTYGRENKSVAPRRMQTPAPDTPNSSNASVEIFKSFRVSMEDPCYKVLPAALKKYQINAPWDQYALYIVYGDQERCLGLDEKPLILFKQLDKEGKKPMFMLRKTNNAQVDLTSEGPGSAGLAPTSGGGRTGTGYDPPGGII